MHTPLAQQAIAALIRRLADPVSDVAESALEALLEFGPQALEPVLVAATDHDSDRATRALQWLARMQGLVLAEPHALGAVLEASQAEDGGLRAAAAGALGAMLSFCVMSGLPGDDRELRTVLAKVHDVLCQGCHDMDPMVREAAARALANALYCDDKTVEGLREALNDSSSRAVRQAAAESLGRIAPLMAD